RRLRKSKALNLPTRSGLLLLAEGTRSVLIPLALAVMACCIPSHMCKPSAAQDQANVDWASRGVDVWASPRYVAAWSPLGHRVLGGHAIVLRVQRDRSWFVLLCGAWAPGWVARTILCLSMRRQRGPKSLILRWPGVSAHGQMQR